MGGKKQRGKKLIALLLAVLTFAGVLFQNDVQAEPQNLIESFQEKGEAVQTENEKEELTEQKVPEDNDTGQRKPLYDAEKIYREAQEIGVGFANAQESSTYTVDPRWNKWDERYAGKLVSASDSGIKIDIVLYRDGGNTILRSWKEGVLGFKNPDDPNNTYYHEQAYCVDPEIKFGGGTFVCQPMSERYNTETIQLVCALLQYIDNNEVIYNHLTSSQYYAIRQCAIWAVLNTVEGWYPQDAYIEFGNGVKCPYGDGDYISGHVSNVMNTGWQWAHDNYQNMTPKDCYYWYNKAYPDSKQPISTWDYEYRSPWIAIQKKPSSNGGYVNGVWYDAEAYAKWAIDSNPAYSLEGAKYTVWNEKTGEYYYDAITTDKYGYGWCYVPESGNYQIQETVPPKGYKLDSTWHPVNLNTTNYTFEHPEPIKTAEIRIHKSSKIPTDKSLAGAKYGVWNWEGSVGNGKPDFVITTDESGYGEIDNLPLWHYYIQEIEAPEGFGLDTTIYEADLREAGSYDEIGVDLYSQEPLAFGKITLQKQSDKPECTDNNNAYSLKGAEYSIYSNQDCTDYIDKLITDESGYAEKDGLKLGTYYVKETKASPGYALDKTIYTVDLTAGSGNLEYQITSKETPLMDPIRVLIKKVDKETGNPVPAGQGSLEGAEFTFKFYKGEYPEDTDPETLGKTADKTWVFATDKTGYIEFSKDYIVSGDEFYYDSSNHPALPVGTLVITETKAPAGYHINPVKIIRNIKPDGTEGGEAYVTPEIEEDSVSVKIIKIQDGNNVRIPGTVFRHTMPDGTTKDYATDDKGEIQLQGLSVGKHQIVELSPAEGYLPNTSVFEFEVTADNQVRAITQITEDMGIAFAEEKNGDGTLTVKNKLAPFKLNIHKINNKDKVLEDAEFTLYEDKDCSVEVDRQVSDKDGNLAFENVQIGREYYLKETKAPAGYKLPINPDGSPVIYKIKVESDPIKNSFIVYVNDKAYDANSNGSITIGGTKKDREVNLTVVNTVSGKLPNTGSQNMLWILAIGSMLMITALKKKEKTIR